MKNKSDFFLAFLTVIFILVCSFRYNQTGEEIIWDPNSNLSWSDFKGKVEIGSDNSAMSSVGIRKEKFEWNENEAKGRVFAYFDKTESWTRTTKNKDLLNHEQGHFDITEIYARKLRKEMNNKKFKKNSLSKDMQCIIDKVETEKNKYQELYDKETNHHKNAEKQIEWDILISSQLNELEKYSDPFITIKIK